MFSAVHPLFLSLFARHAQIGHLGGLLLDAT